MSASPNDTKRPDSKAREAEYQALWQVCDRASRKEQYRYADLPARRALLTDAAKTLMEKRRKIGKAMCDTNIGAMVERHLQREATSRVIHEARVGGRLPPSPAMVAAAPVAAHGMNAGPGMNVLAPMNEPHPLGPGPNGFNNPRVLPFPAPPMHPNVDIYPMNLRSEINAMHQQMALQLQERDQERDQIVSAIRTLAARVLDLEDRLGVARGPVQNWPGAHPNDEVAAGARQRAGPGPYADPGYPGGQHPDDHYPAEGLQGMGRPNFAMRPQRPMTPRSQTQGRDAMVDREDILDMADV